MPEGFNFREVVNKREEIKSRALLERPRISGKPLPDLRDFKDEVIKNFNELYEKNQQLIKEEEKKNPQLFSKFNKKNLFNAYHKGLWILFKQHYALQTKKGEPLPDEYRTSDYIQPHMVLYTRDFIKSLAYSLEDEISPIQALRFATLSYRHRPDIFRKLSKKYGLQENIITFAILHYAKPEEFIEHYKKTVKELSEEFPDVYDSAIVKAALTRPNAPRKFVLDFKATVDRLTKKYLNEKYPDVNHTVIKSAALSHITNAAAFIEFFLQDVEALAKLFPSLGRHTIISVVLKNPPQNRKKALNTYIKNHPLLTEKSNFSTNELKKVPSVETRADLWGF